MSLVVDAPYGWSGSDASAIIESDREHSVRTEGAWQQSLLSLIQPGSAGVVVHVTGYGLYVPHVGTSPTVVDSRSMGRAVLGPSRDLPSDESRSVSRSVLRLSPAEQAREVLAALSINKTQLADVLGVSRPTLYDWLDGQEPNAANAQRLTTLVQLLAKAGVTSASPLSPRFVRQALTEGAPSLLDAVSVEVLDEPLVAKLVREAKSLGEPAEVRRVSREDRLRALGFDEPSDEQRKEQLGRNMAMREWPKA